VISTWLCYFLYQNAMCEMHHHNRKCLFVMSVCNIGLQHCKEKVCHAIWVVVQRGITILKTVILDMLLVDRKLS